MRAEVRLSVTGAPDQVFHAEADDLTTLINTLMGYVPADVQAAIRDKLLSKPPWWALGVRWATVQSESGEDGSPLVYVSIRAW